MKKLFKSKKAIAVILCVVMLIITPISVLAFPNKQECTAKLLQAGDFDIIYDYDGPKQGSLFGVATHDENMTDVERKLSTRIYNALINCQSSISFTFDYVNPDWMMTMYSNVINDHPELFYVSHNYAVDYSVFGGYATTVYPKYVMAKSEIENAKNIFNAGVEKALATVDSSMDDMQKAMTIHDYICENATYDENGDMAHSAYGFFSTGHIVCAGYALSFSYLMNKLGVPCEMVTSRKMNHGWNVVKINGNWYHVDCTWDDNGSGSHALKSDGRVGHYYFLRSLEFMASTRDGIDTFDDCDATDKTYDSGAWWTNVNTNIYTKNGYYYYLYNDKSIQAVFLRKRSRTGSESNLSRARFKCGTTQTQNDAKLTFLDDNFYIYAIDGIHCVSKDGKRTSTVMSFSSTPGGIGSENGKLTYEVSGDFDNFRTIDRLSLFKNAITTDKYYNEYLNYYIPNYNGYVDMNNDGYVNAKDYSLILKENGIRK